MSRPHFFCPDLRVGVLSLDESEARHALQSRRLNAGDEVVLFDGCGGVAQGHIAPPTASIADGPRAKKRAASPAVRVEQIERIPRPMQSLALIVAGCKGPRLTWMIEKLTELAATRIVLARFERSVVSPREARIDKLRRTVIEAGKQSRNYWLPELIAGGSLAEAVANHRAGTVLVAHPDDDASMLGERITSLRASGASATVVIGPEGGLADSELGTLDQAGAERVRLGRTILRVETAAVAVAAVWAAQAKGEQAR